MSMTIGAAIATMNIAKSAAAYLGLIESSSTNINSLVHQAFKSALMNLEYAKTASTQSQGKEYLKEAKNEFIKAIAVEKDECLVSAYVGLAMCQYLLGDSRNAELTINKIASVKLSNAEKMKAGVQSSVQGPGVMFGPLGYIMNGYNGAKEREKYFEEFKLKAIEELL